PMKGVGHGRTENGDISQGKPFAMVESFLHWSTRGEFARQCLVSARQEWSSGIAQVVQVAAPKQSMFAVRGEVVIVARYEHIVVELGGGKENVSDSGEHVSG